MPPLSPSIAEELGNRLRQSRADLIAHIRTRFEGPDGEPAPTTARAHMVTTDDAPEANMMGDDETSLANHEEAALREVDAALARLEAGAAGVCTECGQDIPPERLLATPTVHTCIECQQRLDHLAFGRGPSM